MRTISEEMIERARNADPELSAAIDAVYAEFGDAPMQSVEDYHNRHMTASMLILTVLSESDARELIAPIRGKIVGKTVVEVGAGVGYLALEIARYASRVYAIESDPAWSWVFTKHLYSKKPAHLTWIFGRAEEVAPWLRADVAVVSTHSGHDRMLGIAKILSSEVIEIHERRCA